MKAIMIPCILVIFLYSCNLPPKNVRIILNAAGNNRIELEKVIKHYKASGDKEKLKAAYFLIGNMDDKYALDGEAVRRYDPIFDVFDSLSRKNLPVPQNSPPVNAKWDSLVKLYGAPSIQNAEVFPDYINIKSDYLIENIDLAFKLRDESPWSKRISFEQFCNFVLPYRFRHEPLENWRPDFYEKYKVFRDSVNVDSVIQLTSIVHKHLVPILKYNEIFREYPFDIPLTKMKTIRYQGCPNTAVYTGMAMRSLGLPVTIDYAPLWGNHNNGHVWNALLLPDEKIIWFQGDGSRFPWVFFRKIAKIYRESFASQNIEVPENSLDVPRSLLNNHLIDVTNEYTKTYDIRIPLKYPYKSKKKYAIICTFNHKNWIPQDWGRIEKKQACFNKMGSGIAYIAMYFDNDNLYPASDPFILGLDGKVTHLVPSEIETQSMLLFRKFPCYDWIQLYFTNMVNGRFQGANNADFSDSITIFTVVNPPNKIETASITNPLKFRYVRYKAPLTSTGDIVELEFFGGTKSTDSLKLTGKIIGFPEIPLSQGTPYQNAFDGKLETYFGRITKGYSWAGLDLGTPKRITKIKYCPRSDTNFILVGDTYELCYWKNGEWVSMGEQVAKDQFLYYKNVPCGGLYILHNLSRGKEERIFTYENELQVWW